MTNLYGEIGTRCLECSGLGVLINGTKGSGSCSHCKGTGVEPMQVEELKKEIDLLTARIVNLENLFENIADKIQ